MEYIAITYRINHELDPNAQKRQFFPLFVERLVILKAHPAFSYVNRVLLTCSYFTDFTLPHITGRHSIALESLRSPNYMPFPRAQPLSVKCCRTMTDQKQKLCSSLPTPYPSKRSPPVPFPLSRKHAVLTPATREQTRVCPFSVPSLCLHSRTTNAAHACLGIFMVLISRNHLGANALNWQQKSNKRHYINTEMKRIAALVS